MTKKLAKGFLCFAGLVLTLGALLSLVNLVRFPWGAFHEGADRLIQRSLFIRENARPGYQKEVLASLPANPKNGPFFRLDDQLAKAGIREKPEHRTQDGPGFLFNLEFDDAADPGIVSRHGKAALEVKDGLLRVQHDNADYLAVDGAIDIPVDQVGDIVIRARADKGSRLLLGWQKDKSLTDLGTNSIAADLLADNTFHTYIINGKLALQRPIAADNRVTSIFLKPSNEDGAQVEIDFIRFLSNRSKYLQSVNGAGYETLGHEMRRVLYMLAPQTLEYELMIPERSPAISFGIGILDGKMPLQFELSVSDERRSETIFRQLVSSADGWNDATLDLSPWAGRNVKLALRVKGSGDNVAFWSNPLVSSQIREPFNVILVVQDALRADHLSVYGHELPTSPVTDKLAAAGILFERAISQASETRPSIPALMTSLPPIATGVWGFSDLLDDEYLTLAEVLRSRGFVTASFLQNPNAGPYAGLHQGFDQLLGPSLLGEDPGTIIGERLTNWISAHRDRNFFLYMHVGDPHGPYEPPEPFRQWFLADKGPGTPAKREAYLDPDWVEQPTLEGRRLLYDGEIRQNDSMLPRLMEALESQEIDQNTLVIFTADHGEHLGEHGLVGHGPPGLMPVIHVPLIFSYPERFKTGQRIAQNVQLMDIMPTILEIAGIEDSKLLMQGDSLLSLIEGRDLPSWNDRLIISEEPPGVGEPFACGSLLFRNWHFISSLHWTPDFKVRPFDFQADPQENRVLYSYLADVHALYNYRKTMMALQENSIATWKAFVRTQSEEYKMDPDELERLRSLGYVH